MGHASILARPDRNQKLADGQLDGSASPVETLTMAIETDIAVQEHQLEDGHVTIITIDDGKANALSKSAIGALSAAVSGAEEDTDCVAVVLAGRQGVFSGGFDLSVMQSGDMGAVLDLVSDGGDLVRQLYSCGVPVVAACGGHAVASGALVLLGCDVRVGADGPFKIGLNEVAIGLTLPGWANVIAKERLSKRHVQRAVTNARLMAPAEAADAGFLDVVAPAEDLMETAIATAAELAPLDRNAYGRVMREFRGETIDAMEALINADRTLV